MTRYILDGILIAGVTASLVATAGAFNTLGHRAPPVPKIDQPSVTAAVHRPPTLRVVPEGGVMPFHRVIVRVVETDPHD